ncbi:MAG: F0F1 ATP synthase subunit epsilon [Roseibacillus sp.]
MMTLKILLPFQLLLDAEEVSRIVGETKKGSFGLWPHRLDCSALLVPGILSYESGDQDEHYVAVDEGVLVKTGGAVVVSVRHAVVGGDLGELRHLVEEKFRQIDENERKVRSILAKMESNIIRQTRRLKNV